MESSKLLDRLLTVANEVMCIPERPPGDGTRETYKVAADRLAAGLLDLHDLLCKGAPLPEKWVMAQARAGAAR